MRSKTMPSLMTYVRIARNAPAIVRLASRITLWTFGHKVQIQDAIDMTPGARREWREIIDRIEPRMPAAREKLAQLGPAFADMRRRLQALPPSEEAAMLLRQCDAMEREAERLRGEM